jgi:hypothetical protein
MGWSRSIGPATACEKHSKRQTRRPKLRWEDGMNNDVKALWEINWKTLATNRQLGHNLRKLWPKKRYFSNVDDDIVYNLNLNFMVWFLDNLRKALRGLM